jgi:Domain of unknown function (DUF4167)
MRGRNNNRNKGPNPLTRSYESNGPDVKIRGTAQHIADKYAQLARDAQASGDPVAAENYLQHAEHYYRIIAAAQEQFRDQFGAPYQRPFDDDGDEDAGAGMNGHSYSPQGGPDDGYSPQQPQPQPYEGRSDNGNGERPQRFDRGERQERFGNRPDRNDRPDRGGERQDRGDRQGRERFPRGDRQDFQRSEAPRPEGQRQDPSREPRRERRPEPADEQPNGLPAFLTTPVRAPVSVEDGGEETAVPSAEFGGDEAGGEANGRYGVRTRRRRRSRYGNGAEEGAAEQGSDFTPEGVEPPAE